MTKTAHFPTHRMDILFDTNYHVCALVFESWGIKIGMTALLGNTKQATDVFLLAGIIFGFARQLRSKLRKKNWKS